MSVELINQIKECTVCASDLKDGPNPVVSVSEHSKILIIGQAPGKKVHQSGIPWDDPSGVQLRKWLGVSDEEFYNTNLFGILPMGFCYPGKGATGDLPPRKECAPLWHSKLMKSMEEVELILLIGQYAQTYYLKEKRKRNLTETVRSFKEYQPLYLPLPHPSPRNRFWLMKNKWFEAEIVSFLQLKISSIVNH